MKFHGSTQRRCGNVVGNMLVCRLGGNEFSFASIMYPIRLKVWRGLGVRCTQCANVLFSSILVLKLDIGSPPNLVYSQHFFKAPGMSVPQCLCLCDLAASRSPSSLLSRLWPRVSSTVGLHVSCCVQACVYLYY